MLHFNIEASIASAYEIAKIAIWKIIIFLRLFRGITAQENYRKLEQQSAPPQTLAFENDWRRFREREN